MVASTAESRNPVGEKKVGSTWVRSVPIGRPDELLSIRAEHRKAIELAVLRHLLECGSVEVDEVEVEVTATRILVVRREDDPSAAWREKRREVGPAKVGDLALSGTVSVHDEQLHPIRPHQSLSEQVAIGLELR